MKRQQQLTKNVALSLSLSLLLFRSSVPDLLSLLFELLFTFVHYFIVMLFFPKIPILSCLLLCRKIAQCCLYSPATHLHISNAHHYFIFIFSPRIKRKSIFCVCLWILGRHQSNNAYSVYRHFSRHTETKTLHTHKPHSVFFLFFFFNFIFSISSVISS
jgi:hypothetical protein